MDIYEEYFVEEDDASLTISHTAHTIRLLRDPNTSCRNMRCATHLTWSPDGGARLAVAYANLSFQGNLSHEKSESFIWDPGR